MLESEVVDKLFERMAVRYGSLWFDRYEGVPWDKVRADWAREITDIPREGLAYGVVNLPVDRPPNARQFRMLCFQRPAAQARIADVPAIDEATRELHTEILRRLSAAIKPREVRDNVMAKIAEFDAIVANGGRLTIAQRDWLKSVKPRFTPPSSDTPRDFRGVSSHVLPRSMK